MSTLNHVPCTHLNFSLVVRVILKLFAIRALCASLTYPMSTVLDLISQVLEVSVQAATKASIEKEREATQHAATLAEEDDDDDGGLGGGTSYKSAVAASTSSNTTGSNTTHAVAGSSSSSSSSTTAPPSTQPLSVAAKKLMQRREEAMIAEDLLSISVVAHFQNEPLLPKAALASADAISANKTSASLSTFVNPENENDATVGNTSLSTAAWGHGVPREAANEALNLRSLRTQAQRLGDYAATLQRAPLSTVDDDKTAAEADAIAHSLSYQPTVAAAEPAWMLLDSGQGSTISGKEEKERSCLVTSKVLPQDRSILTAWVTRSALSGDEVKKNDVNEEEDEENFEGGGAVCFLKQPEVVDLSEEEEFSNDDEDSGGNEVTTKTALGARLVWPAGWRIQSLALYGGEVTSPGNGEDQAERVMVVLQSVASGQVLKLAT